MDWTLAIGFWSVSALLAITPGADWAYVIASGTRGRAEVSPAVTGLLLGHLVASAVVAAGVAAVVTTSPAAMTGLTVVGAGYLIWLGVSALRHLDSLRSPAPGPSVGGRRTLVKGMGISLLNPKVFLLFLALLPGFVTDSVALPVGAQMMVLGVLHVANCAVVYFAVGHGSATFLTRSPRAARIVGVVSGLVMIGLGTALVGEEPPDEPSVG